MLSGVNGASSWAVDASESAAYLVEVAVGQYSSGQISEWSLSDEFDHDRAASSLPDHPNVWTDGSLVLDHLAGVSSSGSGTVVGRVTLMLFALILTLRAVEVFVRFLGHFNLFRGLNCGVLFWPCKPLVLFTLVLTILLLFDMLVGYWAVVLSLLSLIDRMLRQRGLATVCISKVKGHADDGMVLHGQVRREDKLGNDAADEAADFGRRRVSPAVIDARRNFSGVCGRWYPVVLDLHRFFIAISRAVVNHDDGPGTAPDPLVWSAGVLHERRRLVHAVRDRAFLPGPPGIWCSEWFQIPAAVVCAEDIALWPYTPGLFVKWVSFLNSLHWPIGDLDLGVGGVSYLELLIMYELCAGERLCLEKAHPRYLRPGRPISVSAVPFGPGIDIWRSRRFIGALMRSLCLLPGGLRRFVPCSFGANHCRLRHIGWERCGHGLTSRPRESAPELFLNELLSLFHGTLPLRYCADRFACKTPTLRLPAPGHVHRLVAAHAGSAGGRGGEVLV